MFAQGCPGTEWQSKTQALVCGPTACWAVAALNGLPGTCSDQLSSDRQVATGGYSHSRASGFWVALGVHILRW